MIDLGTGTGAIALALASERPQWQIVAVDAAEGAVDLAKTNRQRLGFENVVVFRSDWFEQVAAGRAFDLVVSNPPYIEVDDPHLNQGDVRFEPSSALVADGDGLADLARIAGEAPDRLRPGGWLLLEHGWRQGEAVRGLMLAAGFVEVETHVDLAGRDRATLGRWPAAG